MKRISFITTCVVSLALLLVPNSVTADDVVLTPTGVGPIVLGGEIASLPESVDGLYSKLETRTVEEWYEGAECVVSDYLVGYMRGKVIFAIREYPEGVINAISVYSPKVNTPSGLNVKTDISDLFSSGGQLVPFEEGGAGIMCDGVLFRGISMTEEGYNKAYNAYEGADEEFYLSDFADDHAEYIVIADYPASMPSVSDFKGRKKAGGDEYGGSGFSVDWDNVLGILVTVLIALAFLAMVGHMIYVGFFAKQYPEDLDFGKGTPENNKYVKEVMDNLYNVEFTDISEPGDAEPIRYPVGRKVAYHAKEVLDDVFANHMPVDGEAAESLRKVCIVTNDAYKRCFAGSKTFMVVTGLIAIVSYLLTKEFEASGYFVMSLGLYWLSCRTPNYIIIDKELHRKVRSSKLLSGLIAGIFGFAASAPVVTEVTKRVDTGEIVDSKRDFTLDIVYLIIAIILILIVAYMMFFVSIFNYLRNYVFRK